MPAIVKLSPLDMLKLCCFDGQAQYAVDKPFSIGEFAYGTDARICLRIPVVELLELPPPADPSPPILRLNWDRACFSNDPLDIPEDLPAEQFQACECRDGPQEHWAHCEDCLGGGKIGQDQYDRITLAPNIDIALKYARRLQALGVSQMWPYKHSPKGEAPRLFMFTTAHNGVGLLMGMIPK